MENLRPPETDGGFFKITRETPYLLIADKELVTEGDTFIVSFYGEAPTDYVITGVTSADIGGAPLTGMFNNSGEQLTFTATVTGQKDFVLSLDNGKASVAVALILTEHIELFGFSSSSDAPLDVWYYFTFTTTNPNVPSNALIYLVSATHDSFGDLGSYVASEADSLSTSDVVYSGPEILIGTGRSVSGRVKELDGTPGKTSANVFATLKFIW